MQEFSILSKSEIKVLTSLFNLYADNGKKEKDLKGLLRAVNDIAVQKQTFAIRETQRLTMPQKKLI